MSTGKQLRFCVDRADLVADGVGLLLVAQRKKVDDDEASGVVLVEIDALCTGRIGYKESARTPLSAEHHRFGSAHLGPRAHHNPHAHWHEDAKHQGLDRLSVAGSLVHLWRSRSLGHIGIAVGRKS